MPPLSFRFQLRPESIVPVVARVLAQTLILLVSVGTIAQVPASPEPGAADGAPTNSVKKNSRYDISHIGERGIGRGVNLYSIHRERALGESLASSIDRHTKLITDSDVTGYVNELGQTLVRNSDAEFPFAIKVVDSDDMGAFGLPGGFLYIDRGLITALDAEGELASIMAHEIAHIAARHATRAVTRRRISNMIGTIGLFAGPAGVLVQDIGSIAGPLAGKKFSRDAEYEADLLGVEYVYAAGYDPEEFVAALEKLHARELTMSEFLAKVPGYRLATKMPFHNQIRRSFSNYPLTEERIHRLQVEITAFLPDRNEYIIDRSEFRDIKAKLLAADAPVLRRLPQGADPGKGPVLRRTHN